jgi:hypothetical protein
VLALLLAGGCTASLPCEPQPIAACASCAPGEIRYGAELLSFAPQGITQLSSGTLACLSCGTFWFLDATAKVRSHFDVGGTIIGVPAVATDDLYAIVSSPPTQDNWQPPPDQLFAFDPGGAVRWQYELSAIREHVIGAGPAGPYTLSLTTLTAFAAADGSTRWTMPAPPPQMAASALPAPDGGLCLVVYGSNPPNASATIIMLDVAGTPRWMKTLTTTGTVLGVDVFAFDEVGDLLIAGELEGTNIDLGDATITGANTYYAAAVSPSGATLWGYTFAGAGINLRAAAAFSGKLVIAGEYVSDSTFLGLPPSRYNDVVVATFDATGLVAADRLGGPGDQFFGGLAAAPDGSLWVELVNASNSNEPTELVVGARDLRGTSYVVNLVP